MNYIVTAGSSYLDIDAYACCVALNKLLNLKGENAIAYSDAVCNYSICRSLIVNGQIKKELPSEFQSKDVQYIIVDVSDPDFIKGAVPLEQVVEVFDHHTGFEDYWRSCIGDGAHIEFIGAAATQIYEEWKRAELQDQMSRDTALLLIAAILDNTLNLTSSNTTQRDIDAFSELCQKENIDETWCSSYFSEVQRNIEADLKEALFKDVKTIHDSACLPEAFAQLCVWCSEALIEKLPDIRKWMNGRSKSWVLNIIDIKHQCSRLVCDDTYYQGKIEKIFEVRFENGVAKSSVPYLRKEIIKKTKENETR